MNIVSKLLVGLMLISSTITYSNPVLKGAKGPFCESLEYDDYDVEESLEMIFIPASEVDEFLPRGIEVYHFSNLLRLAEVVGKSYPKLLQHIYAYESFRCNEGYDTQFTREKLNQYLVSIITEPTGELMVAIQSALVNPLGSDGGKEEIVLKNEGDRRLDLEGWVLRDRVGRTQVISDFTLNSGQIKSIALATVKLPNKGGLLYLYDNNDRLVDLIGYELFDEEKEGVFIPVKDVNPYLAQVYIPTSGYFGDTCGYFWANIALGQGDAYEVSDISIFDDCFKSVGDIVNEDGSFESNLAKSPFSELKKIDILKTWESLKEGGDYDTPEAYFAFSQVKVGELLFDFYTLSSDVNIDVEYYFINPKTKEIKHFYVYY